MNWEGGAAINRFATNTNGNCLRYVARNKMSLITLGQASASIHIFRVIFFTYKKLGFQLKTGQFNNRFNISQRMHG